MYNVLALLLITSILTAFHFWLRSNGVPGRSGRWVGTLVVAALMVEAGALLLRVWGLPNVVLYNLFTGLELVLFVRLFLALLPEQRGWAMAALVLGIAAMVINLCFERGDRFLLTESIITVAAINTGLSIVALWHLSQRNDRYLWRLPLFWFYMGTLIYFGGIVPFVGMMRFVYRNDADLARVLYWIITALAITRYLLTARACYLATSDKGWDDDHGT